MPCSIKSKIKTKLETKISLDRQVDSEKMDRTNISDDTFRFGPWLFFALFFLCSI